MCYFVSSIKVRKVLTVLIQQRLVSFEKTKRGWTEYMMNADAIVWRNRIPRYIHCAKSLYGDAAELVIEDILHHGQVTMSSAVDCVTEKLNEALENAGSYYGTFITILSWFRFTSFLLGQYNIIV